MHITFINTQIQYIQLLAIQLNIVYSVMFRCQRIFGKSRMGKKVGVMWAGGFVFPLFGDSVIVTLGTFEKIPKIKHYYSEKN